MPGKVISHRDGKKFCTSCLEWLELKQFGKREASYDGLAHRCRTCDKERRTSQLMAHRRLLFVQGLSMCFACGEEKPLSEFYPDKSKWNGVTNRCRTCHKVAMSSATRKYRTGWTKEEYDEALLAQDGRCAICKKPESDLGRGGEVLALSADHCHATGKKRGLLCRRCNQALGKMEDDPKLLRAAADYLEFGVNNE